MLLKYCPVGSVVRLVSYCGSAEEVRYFRWWEGEFEVQNDEGGVFVIDGDGSKRYSIASDSKFQFEIVRPAPEPSPEPRITFTVGGQEFYVGQRVWSLTRFRDVKNGQELRAIGTHDNSLCVHALGSVIIYRFSLSNISTTPPAPHDWKRGDWARHEEYGVGFVCSGVDFVGDIRVDFSGSSTRVRPETLTFISHSEPPE